MKKILYVASSYGHILSFHIPYVEKLQEMGFEVHVVAAGVPEQMENNKSPKRTSDKIEKGKMQAGSIIKIENRKNLEDKSEDMKSASSFLVTFGISGTRSASEMIDDLYNIVKINVPFEKKMLSPKNLACTFQLVKLLKKEQYDIISVHTSLAAFFVRLAVILYRIKRVVGKGHKETKKTITINTVHGYLFDEHTSTIKRNILLCAEKLTKSATDILVVMNEQDYEIAQKYGLYKNKLVKIPGVGIDTERFSREKVEEELLCNVDKKHFAMNNVNDDTIYNIQKKWSTINNVKNNKDAASKTKELKNTYEADLEQLKNSERAKLGINSEDIVMIYAAEFSKRKNQRMLIEAMSKLPNNVKLLLAGKGEQLEECKKLDEQLGLNNKHINEENLNENNEHSQSKLENRVLFLGHVKNLEQYYYISDICVSSSRSEGLPFNVMEAMAMGLPVIATNVKGHQDLVEPAINGYLYDYDNIDSFVEAVMRLIDTKKCEIKINMSQKDGQISEQAIKHCLLQKNINISQNNIIKAKKYSLDNVMDEVLSVYKDL